MEFDVDSPFCLSIYLTRTDFEDISISNLPNNLKMSLMKKFFNKRNKKEMDVKSTASAETTESTQNVNSSFITCGTPSDIVDASSERFSSSNRDDGCDSDDDSEYEEKRKRLQAALHSFKACEARKKRRQQELMYMEAEIGTLLGLIALCRRQREQMGEDMQNKKCEMKFLRSEVPEGCESDCKKREPLLYKKYTNLKSVTEARNHLNTIRNRQRALQYLELMTYNKYLELQHNLKFDGVKKRTSVLLKDKARNFGHLMDVLQRRIETGSTQTQQPVDLSTASSAQSPVDFNVSNTFNLQCQGTPSGGSSPIDALSEFNEAMPFDVTPPRSTNALLPTTTTPPLPAFLQRISLAGRVSVDGPLLGPASPEMDVD